MARLVITLLGPFAVTLEEEPVTAFKSHKVQALLAYLAAEPDRPHPRRVLADLLWPDRTERDALRNLSYALTDLRTVICDREADPPFLTITRDTLKLPQHSQVHVDARDLWACTGPEQNATAEDLQRAVALCRGHFLEGFAVDSAPFEEWLVLKREQCARVALEALRRLAVHHEARGEWDRVCRYARRQLELEPWDEAAHRQLMRALSLGGHRGAALAHYDACRRSLAEGLGVDPDADTQALYEKILAGTLESPAPALATRATRVDILPPPQPETRGARRFVGRELELERLWQHLDNVLQGQGRVVFVLGEPGSGKTWLLQELARRAISGHADLLVAVGHCNAYAGTGDPYLPFVHILRALTGDLSDQWAEGVLPEEHAERLSDALPEVASALVSEGWELLGRLISGHALLTRLEDAAPGREGIRERLERAVQQTERVAPLEQTHLFEQCVRFLRRLTRERPLLIVLDDLQWADPSSISLLFHLGRSVGGQRILIAGACRSEVLANEQNGGRHPLAPVIGELRILYGDVCVDLDRSDGHAFIQALVDSYPNSLGAEFRDTLGRHTGGQPLFTVELLRGLQERGDLAKDPQGRWGTRGDVDWAHLPVRVEALIAERVGALPRAHRDMLRVASVEGEEFTAEVLAAASGADVRDVLRTLGTSPLRNRLVVSQGVRRVDAERLTRYRFRHALYCAYLYDNLDAGRRAHLHEQVADALEGLYGDRVGEVEVALARHYAEAGLTFRALLHLRHAARHALDMAAPVESGDHCRRGLALLEREPESAERAEHEAYLLMLLARSTSYAKDSAAPELAVTLERAEQVCRRYNMERELIWVLALRTTTLTTAMAREPAEEALALAKRVGSPAFLALARHQYGRVVAEAGETLASLEALEQVLDTFSRPSTGDDILFSPRDLASRSLARTGMVLWFLGYPDQALERCERAVAVAEQQGWPFTENFVRFFAAPVRYLRGDWEEAQRHMDVLAEKEAFIRKPVHHLLGVQVMQACYAIAAGGGAALFDDMLEVYEAYRRSGPAQRDALGILSNVIDACAQLGRADEGLALVDEGLAISARTGAHWVDPSFHTRRGQMLLRRDEDEEAAEACFRQSLQVALRQTSRSYGLRAATSLARLWHSQGRHEEALEFLAPMYDWFTEGLFTVDLREARALLDELGYQGRAKALG